jgi:putative ABC transport system permease protein
MLKNYFKTAFRNLTRNKAFSFINIIGLSIGICAALVIFLIAQYDYSFDKFHKDGGRIYRVVTVFSFSGEEYKNPGVSYPMPNTIRKEATGLELTVPFALWPENQKIEIPATAAKFKKNNKTIFTDESYFKLIQYQWIAGNAAVSLQDPNQVVLSDKMAEIYFPKTTPAEIIGKEIVFDDTVRTTVTGIVKSLEGNTDFTFNTFISRATQEKTTLKPRDWNQWNNTTDASQLFVKLSPGTTTAGVEKQLAAFLTKYTEKNAAENNKQVCWLQPLSDLHFNADYGNFDQRTAHKPTLYGLLAVAVFLLLLGCINFINLTTAQASQRAKEIGIRKTMGSSKKQLVYQFLGETFFITLIATILSILLTPVLLKIFGDFIPPELHFSLTEQPLLLVFLAGLVIVVSVLSGLYPAWVLSAFRPVNVLKNQSNAHSGRSRKAWIRKSLTISQFIIAQVFILATLVVSKQIHYTLNKDLGFKKNAIVHFTVDYHDTSKAKRRILAERIRAIPGVATVGLSTGTPSAGDSWSSTITYKDGKKETTTDVSMKFGDTSYLKQFALQLVAGKNYIAGDTVSQFLINETYARALGFADPQKALGKYLSWSNKNILIAGVVKDFHQKSLHEVIKPLVIGNWGQIHRQFSVSLQPQSADGNNWKTAIAKIGGAWKQLYPDYDFDYAFLDESIAKYYKAEQNISRLLKWATGLAIFISCLGLLGLVMYTTNQRTKEIGVRKVLGASVSHIVSILSKDFLVLVLIAFLIAAPVAWWAMHKWLENFAYRTSINGWLFMGAGLLTTLVAMATISFQTFKAASANPVKSLRTE